MRDFALCSMFAWIQALSGVRGNYICNFAAMENCVFTVIEGSRKRLHGAHCLAKISVSVLIAVTASTLMRHK